MIYLSRRHNREAKAILDDTLLAVIREQLPRLRELPQTDEPLHLEITGDSGHEYQVEISAEPDPDESGALVVTGMIADGWLSSYVCLPPFIKCIVVTHDGEIAAG